MTCIVSLKQTVDYYKSQASPVYICYLGSSKAFNTINHWTLSKKLIDRNVPAVAVRLLFTWYTTQQFSVQCGLSLSSCFYVSYGIRQGGILSPSLFNGNIDDLSTGLTELMIENNGCNFNGVFVNHLVYANDSFTCPFTLSTNKAYWSL